MLEADYQETNWVTRGLELSVLTPDFQGGESSWRSHWSQVAGDLINHAIKNPDFFWYTNSIIFHVFHGKKKIAKH